MGATCRRAWEVHAARDARLGAAARDSLERHLATCPDCAAERASISRQDAQLRRTEPPLDQLALRRLKQKVLEEAHAQLVAPPRLAPSHARRWLMAAVAVLAVALVLGGYAFRHHDAQVTRAPAPWVATAVGTAQWEHVREADRERVVLKRGTLRMTIRRALGDAPVVVSLPDGEIEDLGTRFEVSVQDGATRAITVSEGVIVFHRAQGGDLRLVAPAHWASGAVALAPSPAAEVTAPVPAPLAEPAEPVADARPRKVARRAAAVRDPGSSPTLLAAPNPDAEDLAYLQLLALLREGRTEEARLSAAAYLSKFPQGFRRPEVERLAR